MCKDLDEDSRCFNCIRLLFFILNSFSVLAGCSLIAIGWFSWGDKTYFDTVANADPIIIEPLLITIVLGGLFTLTGLLGIAGSLWKQVAVLRCFSIIVMLLVILMVASSYYTNVYKDNVLQRFQLIMEDSVQHYQDKPHTADIIQSHLKCCGVAASGPSDWNTNPQFNCSTAEDNQSDTICSVPESCCKPNNSNLTKWCEYNSSNQTSQGYAIYTEGCVTTFSHWLQKGVFYLATFTAIASILQFLLILLSNEIISRILTKRQLDKASWKQQKDELISSELPTTWDSDIDFSNRSSIARPSIIEVSDESPPTYSDIGDAPAVSPWTVAKAAPRQNKTSTLNKTVIQPQRRTTLTSRYGANEMSSYATASRTPTTRKDSAAASSTNFATVRPKKVVGGRTSRPMKKNSLAPADDNISRRGSNYSFVNSTFSARDGHDSYHATDV